VAKLPVSWSFIFHIFYVSLNNFKTCADSYGGLSSILVYLSLVLKLMKTLIDPNWYLLAGILSMMM